MKTLKEQFQNYEVPVDEAGWESIIQDTSIVKYNRGRKIRRAVLYGAASLAVAGIVALWMQAASECGKQLSLSEVKQIMKETAIRDEWVTLGANASHFGNGKINALGGVKYILEQFGGHGYEVGDVNHDGEVNIADVTILIDHLLNSENDVCPICADVSGDGEVNIADVTALIDRILANG